MSRPTITTILFVQDLQASARLYRQAFGWKTTVEAPNYVEFECGVGLMHRPAAASFAGQARALRPRHAGTLSAELYVYVDDPQAVLHHLQTLGAELTSPFQKRGWGDDAGYVIEADGHVLGIAQRPATQSEP